MKIFDYRSCVITYENIEALNKLISLSGKQLKEEYRTHYGKRFITEYTVILQSVEKIDKNKCIAIFHIYRDSY